MTTEEMETLASPKGAETEEEQLKRIKKQKKKEKKEKAGVTHKVDDEYDVNEPTIAEKLASLDLVNEDKSNVDKLEPSPIPRPPSADSVHLLLKQALHADDHALLLDCLYARDEKVLCGSYFAVAGALIGVINPGRMSMFFWGLVKEGFLGKPANTNPATAVYVSPAMVLAIISAVFSVRYNLKKAVNGSQARPVAKPLQSSVKSKLK